MVITTVKNINGINGSPHIAIPAELLEQNYGENS